MENPREFWIDDVSTDSPYSKAWRNLQDAEEKIRGRTIHVREVLPDEADKLTRLMKANEKLTIALKTCENDYWFMINLIENYGSNKDETLKDCLERMKFRKPIFTALKSAAEIMEKKK
jgi:c-di-GMP-related signal transduction protein